MLNKYLSRIQTMFYLTNRHSTHPWAQAQSSTVQWRLRSIEISWLFIAPCIFQGPWADRGLWTQLKSSGEKLLPSVLCLLKINWILKSKEKRYKATSSQSHTKRGREGGREWWIKAGGEEQGCVWVFVWIRIHRFVRRQIWQASNQSDVLSEAVWMRSERQVTRMLKLHVDIVDIMAAFFQFFMWNWLHFHPQT